MPKLTAYDKDIAIQRSLASRFDVYFHIDDVNKIRRAALTLHSWNVQECGDYNDYCSWSIERDENDIPYRVTYFHHDPGGHGKAKRVADREKGAIARINETLDKYGLRWYYQTDPRGCPVHVYHPKDHENIDSRYPSVGVAIEG